MTEMKSKRAWVIFLISFTCLNYIIFLFFSANIEKNNKLWDTYEHVLHHPENAKINFKYYLQRKLVTADKKNKWTEFEEIRTDVDRIEDRMKKKKFLKMKRLFEKNCLHDQNLCQDLQEFVKKGKIMLTDITDTKTIHRTNNLPTVKKNDFTTLPDVLIIGAKKAGTRALLSFLCLHPLVKAAGPEVHFFDRYFYRGIAWYRNQLPKCTQKQLLIEKTPAYFVDKDVPKRVANTLPNIKILLVVRDPVTRAISDYTQGLSNHGLRHSFENIAFKNVSTGLVNVAWGPVRGGLYSKHFQRWRKYFNLNKMHVISGENLVANPAEELKSVQEFLGLDVLVGEKNFYFNATKGFPCIVMTGNTHCLGYSKGRSHPNVSKDSIQILREFYRPFNQKFYKLVGKDFGWP